MMQSAIRLAQFMLSSGLALAAMDPSMQIRDVNGGVLSPFLVEAKAVVLFFLSTECPISRFYAPQIQTICSSYRARGVTCRLVYEDLPLTPRTVRQHLVEFGYRGIAAAIDESGDIAKKVGARVTPEAIVIDKAGHIRYRGRIDNFYADLGKPRREVTVHDLTDALDAVLAGRPVPHPETKPIGCFITSPEVLESIQSEGGRK
jgi:thiol-disulfide isomerase/thioredoxin